MSYKITIIDNDTNEVLFDTSEAVAIIGAVTCEDKSTHCLGFTECNSLQLLATLKGVETAKDAIFKNSPELRQMLMITRLMDVCKSDSDPTNND